MERFHHRRVILERGDDEAAAALGDLGYVRSTHLVLAHAREPDRRVDTSMVHEVEFERLVPARTAATIAEPWGDDDIATQLNDAKRLIMRVVPTRFFAAIVDDRVAAYCEVRSDGRSHRSKTSRRFARTAAVVSAARSCSTRSTRHAAVTTSSSSRRSPTTGRASCTRSSASTRSTGVTS